MRPGSLAFWLLIGFGPWRASQEIRGREESGVGIFISLVPFLWHCGVSLSKGHHPSEDSLLYKTLLPPDSSNHAFPLQDWASDGPWLLVLGHCGSPGGFLTPPTPL